MAPKINIIKSNALVICECQTNCEILRRKTNIQKTKPLLAKATKPMPKTRNQILKKSMDLLYIYDPMYRWLKNIKKRLKKHTTKYTNKEWPLNKCKRQASSTSNASPKEIKMQCNKISHVRKEGTILLVRTHNLKV